MRNNNRNRGGNTGRGITSQPLNTIAHTEATPPATAKPEATLTVSTQMKDITEAEAIATRESLNSIISEAKEAETETEEYTEEEIEAIRATNEAAEAEANRKRIIDGVEAQNRQEQGLALAKSTYINGGPLPEFNMEKANYVTPEPSEEDEEEIVEEAEEEYVTPDWVTFAQRVLGYEGEDSTEAWQATCLFMPNMVKFYNYTPSYNLLNQEQVEYLKTFNKTDETEDESVAED